MYFESRGSADLPTVICSAVSNDMLDWEHEDGIRLQGFDGVGGPRYLPQPAGPGRLFCFASMTGPDGKRSGQSVVSAVSSDGLTFEFESGFRMRDKQSDDDTAGITAAEVLPPQTDNGNWTMFFSAWQDVPEGTIVPRHPSHDPGATISEDFAAASIASDMAGYRSRIFVAQSPDGLTWERFGCAITGGGYDCDELDAVHSEDMSLIDIGDGQYRMYYAACDRTGNWRIASAVSKARVA